ncbi:MAG: fumarylacetoacetate hydrolase family protein, partial [Bacteroidota bacterium]
HREALISAAGELEAEISNKLKREYENLSAMMDYEVELGFVLLASISAEDLENDNFAPQLGYFIANDLSARSLAVLGEGSDLRYEYWGISKSFPNFLPISDKIWIPNHPSSNSIPCIRIETRVNGAVRQSQTTDNMIYTPLEMLRFIQEKYPDTLLERGDMVLTGTPGGVAFTTPRFLVRLSNLLGFDRYRKLSVKLGGDQAAFLKKGDQVEIRGEGFESVKVRIGE